MPKTALMGSPLAVIGTVFRHRRTLAKTGAAVGGVLMLPILFLVMLPDLDSFQTGSFIISIHIFQADIIIKVFRFGLYTEVVVNLSVLDTF